MNVPCVGYQLGALKHGMSLRGVECCTSRGAEVGMKMLIEPEQLREG